MGKLKGELNNQYLIEFLCIKSIIEKIKMKGLTISINEISYNVFALYWQIEITENNSEITNAAFNQIKYDLISKYGLSTQSSIHDIEQILNYIDNKSIQIRLYSVIKPFLTYFSDPNRNKELNNYIINELNALDIDNAEFFGVNKNISIEVNPKWSAYFKNNNTFILAVDNKIKMLEDGTFNEIIHSKPEDKYQKENKEVDFSSLLELENRMRFHTSLNKTKYICLEEALEWMNMDLAKYVEKHKLYVDYIQKYGFKKTTTKLPLVTSAMLIYTAIYRYNDVDSSGFWPEFFGGKDAYNYSHDVPFAMKCITDIIKKYEIDSGIRSYLQKVNLAEIFSQIYLPETSLTKILSAIYNYYFKGFFINKLINKIDFIEKNEYRLDKPGFFFISDDKANEDIFYDLVELIRDGLKDMENTNKKIPDRFRITLKQWIMEDKKEIDKMKDEYYIANPKIRLDVINEEMKIILPKQKSRDYSDDIIRWNIIVDGNHNQVDGRMIRQKNGSYLILEERLKINTFKKIMVEYIFNDEKSGAWDFTNNQEYLLFDRYGTLLNKNSVNRDGCFLAIHRGIGLEIEEIIERYHIPGWMDYMFYYLELEQYREEKLIINEEINVDIDENPVVKKKHFKFLFENPIVSSSNEVINIYKILEGYEIISPSIKKDDIQIIFDNVEKRNSKIDLIEINQANDKTIQLSFDQRLESGAYSIIIKYKNKNIYRENFILDKTSIINREYEISYNQEETKLKIMRINSDSGIEIKQYDYKTKVKKEKTEYIIETEKASESRFIYKRGDSEILIREIVEPIKLELTGLEEVIEATGGSRVKEITKDILISKNLNLHIKNLDSRYKYLNYELVFIDNISGNIIKSSKKVEFTDEFDWNIKELHDRIINLKNMDVKLEIKDNQGIPIYSKLILRIKEYISIYDFQSIEDNENKLLLRWKESQSNNQRQIVFYNITNPTDKVLKFDLKDGVTEFELNLNKMKYGVYMPLVEFKKRDSLFNLIESNVEFFERAEIKYTFIVNKEETNNTNNKILSRIIWSMYKEEYNDLCPLIYSIDLEEVELHTVLYALIQMKYFANKTRHGKQALLDLTYNFVGLLLKKYTKNELVRYVVKLKDVLLNKDLSYILSSLLSFEKAYRLDEEVTDTLLEVNLISALLSLENGKNELSNQIKKESKEQFDYELLSSDTIHNYNKIFDIISNEMKIISEFWNWLIKYENRHLLKYKYTKARLFRIYVEENKISTYKVLGRTLDDLVNNMVDGDKSINPVLSNKWDNIINIEKEIYESFIRLINENAQVRYINVLKAAFISVTRLPLYSDNDYFDLMMKSELSNQKDIFNRYRAYLKLIFI